MFIRYPLQDEAEDDLHPGPGMTKSADEKVDETNRGDELTPEQAAMAEDEKKQPERSAAEEVAKAEKKALGDNAEKEVKKEVKKEEEKEEKKARAPSKINVPKHRLDAVQSARRSAEARAAAAEQKLAELEALQTQAPVQQQAVQAPVTPLDEQIEALDKKIDDLTEDGKADEAREARRELRALERKQMREEAQMEATTIATESVQQQALRVAIENVEDALPALNPDSESYDEVLSANVNELADAFEAKGLTPAEAIYKALEFAVPTTEEAEEGEAEEGESQVEKNIDAATRQPANMNDASKSSQDSDKAGLRAGKIDVMNMSEKAFDEFISDEEQEKIARGDVLGA